MKLMTDVKYVSFMGKLSYWIKLKNFKLNRCCRFKYTKPYKIIFYLMQMSKIGYSPYKRISKCKAYPNLPPITSVVRT